MHKLLIIIIFITCHRSVSSNREDVIDIFMCVLRCLEGMQVNPTVRCFNELEAHATTILYISNIVGQNGALEARECTNLLEELHQWIVVVLQQFDAELPGESAPIPPPTIRTRTGRPRYDLTAEQIELCLGLGLNWQGIASLFGIGRRTLYRHRQRLDVPPLQHTQLSRENLLSNIRHILERTPNAGETYVRASLRHMGLHIQRRRVREALQAIDPIGRCVRHRQAIRRRTYNVRGPNELW